jgi:hypothetical protein
MGGSMRFIRLTALLACVSSLFLTNAQANDAVAIAKSNLIAAAQKYEGQGDPDYKIQNELQPLVDTLLAVAPKQGPIKDRLPILAGTWKQVWGPYDYRNKNRGVDPELGVLEIYQYVSIDGYYYNVSPQYKNGDKTNERIGFLRGEYVLNSKNENGLDVEFTRFKGVNGRPTDDIWTLAPLSEAGQVENEITIVPTWIVKLFFGGGTLIEVYTDKDLRVLYGTGSNFESPYLYVMTRVN